MPDIYTKRKRALIMGSVRGENTKPEIRIQKISKELGLRFSLHKRELPGKPDIAFVNEKRVIFVHGCFWHGHKYCNRSKLPTSNRQFWKDKIEGNIKRDRRVIRKLNRQGWKTLTFWECQIRKSNQKELKKRIARFIESLD